MVEPRRIGLIVNPIAGIGGPLAKRGSDLLAGLQDACKQGGQRIAQQRAERALTRLRQAVGEVPILTPAGAMGADVAARSGFRPVVVTETGERTTARDTSQAVRALVERGIDLLLFAGGDGTARDIFAEIGRAHV